MTKTKRTTTSNKPKSPAEVALQYLTTVGFEFGRNTDSALCDVDNAMKRNDSSDQLDLIMSRLLRSDWEFDEIEDKQSINTARIKYRNRRLRIEASNKRNTKKTSCSPAKAALEYLLKEGFFFRDQKAALRHIDNALKYTNVQYHLSAVISQLQRNGWWFDNDDYKIINDARIEYRKTQLANQRRRLIHSKRWKHKSIPITF